MFVSVSSFSLYVRLDSFRFSIRVWGTQKPYILFFGKSRRAQNSKEEERTQNSFHCDTEFLAKMRWQKTVSRVLLSSLSLGQRKNPFRFNRKLFLLLFRVRFCHVRMCLRHIFSILFTDFSSWPLIWQRISFGFLLFFSLFGGSHDICSYAINNVYLQHWFDIFPVVLVSMLLARVFVSSFLNLYDSRPTDDDMDLKRRKIYSIYLQVSSKLRTRFRFHRV